LNKGAQDRFNIVRIKQLFETERLNKSIDNLNKKLLEVLYARVRALELPKGALNSLQFQDLCHQSEDCLKCLALEVLYYID
jgi:hypothetical protein